MSLFGEIRDFKSRSKPKPGALTWILLHRRTGNLIQWELSLPKSVDDDGTIGAWAERIILAPVAVDEVDEALLDHVDLDDAAEMFDPIVTRKNDVN